MDFNKHNINRRQFLKTSAISGAGMVLPNDLLSRTQTQVNYQIPKIADDFVNIFNPNDHKGRSKDEKNWYTNDHCFIKGNDGVWHAYGIIGHHPVSPWKTETNLFHISAGSLTEKKWEEHDYALTVKPSVERVLWAPHVIQDNGKYHMFYNIGNMQENAPNYASWGQLSLATSENLFDWKRHNRNPLFSDPGHARDSYIMKHKDKYYFYYTRTVNETDLRSAVAVRTGPDLLHWSGPKIVHIQPYEVDWGGDAESPFVSHKDGLFYLFICKAMSDYNQTDVYWSEDPEDFPIENFVCSLPVHTAEVKYGNNKGWFISDTVGIKKEYYLAPLKLR